MFFAILNFRTKQTLIPAIPHVVLLTSYRSHHFNTLIILVVVILVDVVVVILVLVLVVDIPFSKVLLFKWASLVASMKQVSIVRARKF